MKLNEMGLYSREEWTAKGYRLPEFDHAAMKAATRENPFWLHFGAGNIFKAFQANVVQNLLNEGVLDRGLIAAGNHETMEQLSRPHDDLSLLVTLKADGSTQKTVVGSVAEFLTTDKGYDAEFARLGEIMEKDSLQMVSFTITEKGYRITGSDGSFLPDVAKDLENGPEHPDSYMGKIASLLYRRYLAGERPIAMVSMDNCSHNGDKLREAILPFARTWSKNGCTQPGFRKYVEDPQKVSFPWSMIDKITPRPNAKVEKALYADGIEDLNAIVTGRGTVVAPFVNAEECEYLVIEDDFPNGRPQLERGGLIFTDRATVDKVERMKVCTCLNPLHTTLAVFGCLLGYDLISKEMENPVLRKLVERIGYQEGLPVVVNPGVLDPKAFLDTVLNVRIPNPFMPDAPQRIACDTSLKLPIRFGETIKAYRDSDCLNVQDLKCIPLVFAGWLRYLLAVDDNGESFELSADPILDTLRPVFAGTTLGSEVDAESVLRPILSNDEIFGVDLYEVGMADLVCRYFTEMLVGPGAVLETLRRYV